MSRSWPRMGRGIANTWLRTASLRKGLAVRCPSALSSLPSAPGDRRRHVSLFGRKQNESDKPNPQLDAVLERLSPLSLPQLAAEVMTEGFSSNYDPGDTGR